MKKKLGVFGLAAATLMAVAGIGSNVKLEDNTPGYSEQHNGNSGNKQAENKTPAQNNSQVTPVERGTKLMPKVRYASTYQDYGCSPKEWGMYLQRERKQKWVKKIG